MGTWIVIKAEAEEVQASAMHRWHGGYLVVNEDRMPSWEKRGILSGHETAEEAKAEAIRLCRESQRPDVDNVGWHETVVKPSWCHDAVLPGRFPEVESAFVAMVLGSDLSALVEDNETLRGAVEDFAKAEGYWVSRMDYAERVADLIAESARKNGRTIMFETDVSDELRISGAALYVLDTKLIARLIPGVIIR